MSKQVLGEELKLLRQQAQMSQDDVTEKSGLARNQIISIERGKGNPTVETILKYLDAVGGQLKVTNSNQ